MNTSKHNPNIRRDSNKQGLEQTRQRVLSAKHSKLISASLPPSPSHEFSFKVSLHPASTTPLDGSQYPPQQQSFAIDLSPADDIFFQGRLLPLHLMPTTAPSSSNNLVHKDCDHMSGHSNSNSKVNNANTGASKERSKPKSSSMFGLEKWRKVTESDEKNTDMKKKAAKFDVGRVLKGCMKLIQPLFSRGEKEKREFRRHPYSVSGNLNSKWKERRGRRWGEFSAPASMRTSPTNSGLLFTTGISSSNDSTMEELQNAIQAAIAHCKNSIAVKEEKCKL